MSADRNTDSRLDRPLQALQLSARARTACERLGIGTVREFLLLPAERWRHLPGCRARTREEVERKICRWLADNLRDPDCDRTDQRPLLPFVGSRAAERALLQLGIRTVGQFQATPKERVLAFPGVGEATYRRITAAIERARPLPTPTVSLWPPTLRQLPLRQTALPGALLQQLEDLGCSTLGHVLALQPTVFGDGGDLGPAAAASISASLDQLFRVALEQVDTRAADDVDWPTLRGRLLAPLDEGDRELFCHRLGLDSAPRTTREYALQTGRSVPSVQAQEEDVRARLCERAPSLLARLQHEASRELEAFEGVMRGDRLAAGTLLQMAGKCSGDRDLPLRLVAFCFPTEFHQHGNSVSALPARTLLHFLHKLRALTAPRMLPRPLDELVQQLRSVVDPVPRGLLLHLLADRCRLRVHIDADNGEQVLPHQPAVSTRLVEMLDEIGRPTRLEDLVFDYRERYRAASRQRLVVHLRRDAAFLELGPDVWSLRSWHHDELQAVQGRAETVVLAIGEAQGRQRIDDLLAGDPTRTRYLVLDFVRRDKRVRYLGRGEACSAACSRSRVLEQLMVDFRRAAGEVVYSRFVENQPADRRRLVERLLVENRLFVFPAPDRIDVLTNYPFNPERLDRLRTVVDTFLQNRNGYAPLPAVLDEVNRCELGGGWLTPTLLGELLRRHGDFEVLPGAFIARGVLGLGGWLLRRARNALREASMPISLQEILAERPELTEFANCLVDLLKQDPLVQTPDGTRFQIA